MGDGLQADLVLEGGGVKGIALVGAIERLEARGYRFVKVAGSSAGAAVAALVAAGMPAKEMLVALEELELRRIADRVGVAKLRPFVGPTIALLKNNGVFAGEYLREWIGGLLAQYGVETFDDLKDKERELVVTATDLRLGRLVHLPGDYEKVYGLDPGRQRVADAVRASTSLPFVFRPYPLQASFLVDGGILSNFPIDLFDVSADVCPERPTFGVKILPRLPLQEGDNTVLPNPRLWLRPLRLAGQLIGTMIGGHDQARVDLPWVNARTIRVDASAAQIVDFGIGPEVRKKLLDAGRVAVDEFLEGWDFREYCRTYRGCDPG